MQVKLSNIAKIITQAQGILKQLKDKHSGPKSYLVFSSNLGQSSLKSGIDLLTEFPEMFLPETTVKTLSEKLKEKAKVEKQLTLKSEELGRKMRELNGKFSPGDEKDIQVLKNKLKAFDNEICLMLTELVVKDEVFVEIRFEQLNFDFIQSLKDDPLVSQEFTIREKSGIRIVLFRVNDVDV